MYKNTKQDRFKAIEQAERDQEQALFEQRGINKIIEGKYRLLIFECKQCQKRHYFGAETIKIGDINFKKLCPKFDVRKSMRKNNIYLDKWPLVSKGEALKYGHY